MTLNRVVALSSILDGVLQNTKLIECVYTYRKRFMMRNCFMQLRFIHNLQGGPVGWRPGGDGADEVQRQSAAGFPAARGGWSFHSIQAFT